ncbi:DUF302 domain-containing protein [Tunturiibacter empetritectus]|uniref:Uncharacterized protein (DUF302 family) n=2 Tax=Tunturiibacter TaxID=3154218 RepID=A0A852VG47_9BACT|nr:DUF302 domain-containing protein [Edaphobacter lichenicola]NYF91793.1 uncharacterized protein (DUF302 family) [Edaphobacter lichenicola]
MTDQQTHEGIKSCTSRYSVDETVSRLEALLKEKGVKLFAIVDHSGEASAAGFEMHPTKLLIFGSPKSGTPVMLAAPSAALDLPLKILVAEGADGKVLLSWNDPVWLEQRHGFPAEFTANLAAAGLLAAKAAQ